jgi:hypothetical protein
VATERYVVAARLQPGRVADAEQELAGGPPFDPHEAGLSRHAAYATETHVYLVFEGEAARSKALQLARDHLVEVSRWQTMVTGLPSRVDDVPSDARCLYRWDARTSPSDAPES